ncbi:MAG: DUF975 family protein [Defluviitaleaceae bacterium]|nr:DUF975 family protein [Defluviitaleaceae bacterium]MCL2273838.1 DUF975 family protein [Defluviitaleaceae bacterium]
MLTRQEIKRVARHQMAMQRGTAILLGILVWVIGFISGVIDTIIGFIFPPVVLAGVQIGSPMFLLVYWVGYAVIVVASVNMTGEFIKIYRGEEASAANIFNNMSVNFLRKLGGMLWMTLWIFLWTMLCIIPGLIKALSYYFTPNILADCPNVTARQALKISMKITRGYKLDIFVFILSFLGWALLGLLTCGILTIVFVAPYQSTADGGLYLQLRDRALEDGVITHEELGWDAPSDTPPQDSGFQFPPQDDNNNQNW